MADVPGTPAKPSREPPAEDSRAGGAGNDEAAREALARAMAAARDAGLRPGVMPKRRRPRGESPAGAPGPDARDPLLIGSGVERLMRERGWDQDVSAASVMGRWPVLVGADIAEKATPVSFEDGVLQVRATSTAWATQLTYMVPSLLAAIEEAVGPGVVASIRVSGPSAPSWKKGPRRASGRGPRDTYG